MKIYFTTFILIMLTGCSQLQKVTINNEYIVSSDDLSSNIGVNKEQTRYPKEITPDIIANLSEVNTKLSKSSGIDFDYILLDSDGYSYAVITRDDKPHLGYSIKYLSEVGHDKDILYSTSSHLLGHIQNGSTDKKNETLELSMFVIRQIVSTTLSMIATPVAGYASSTALSGAESGVKLLDENKANETGLNILIDANIEPCGYIKEFQHYDKNVDIASPTKLLTYHSGVKNRYDLAKAYLDKHPSIKCEDFKNKTQNLDDNDLELFFPYSEFNYQNL